MTGCVRVGSSAGQGSVELIAALPVVGIVALACFQLMAVGYATVLAGNAAEAGALALAAGGDAERAAREAVPDWQRSSLRAEVDRGTVRVSLQPPSPIAPVAEALVIESEATVEAP